jgi:hypothetical protein
MAGRGDFLGILGRARGFFKGLAAPPEDRVQYYSVLCPEGHRVRGQRTEGYQAIRCPACGEGVFVLPVSPLPEPVPPPSRSRQGRAGHVRPAAVVEGPVELSEPDQVTVDIEEPDDRLNEPEIIWDDEPAPARPATVQPAEFESPGARPSPREASAEQAPKPAPQAGDRPPAAERKAARSRTPEPEGRSQPAPSKKRKRASTLPDPELLAARMQASSRVRAARRPAMILLAVVLLVLSTIAFRTWRTRRSELPHVAEVGKREGIPALEAGRFDKAYQLLAPAREAVDALGGAVEDADTIRHAADEADIFVNLLSDSLETLLEEAGRTSPQNWTSQFDNLYRGRSVILDAHVIATPEDGTAHRYELDYVVLPAGDGTSTPRHARIDLGGLKLLELTPPKVGDRLVFGARLAAFEFDTDAEEWVVRFEPRSGVFIRYSAALETLGWPNGSLTPQDVLREEGGS